ncbi:hypothetical protein BYT27DRAFT_7255242 [Phlegmacium glaucopus]|nr:hypothetical protein BYT27DRAFT_7255242 [Phlegmacium glaucopus]
MAPHQPFLFTCMTKLPTGAHIHTQHQKFAPKEPSTPPNLPAPFDDPNLNDFNELREEGPEQAQNTVVEHLILDRTPCNKEGVDLPPDAPPLKSPTNTTDYSPYNNHADVELANFLFAKNQMPGSQINELLDIWAAKSDVPPFADHKDLYHTINSMIVGDAPWSSFLVIYSGP